MRSEIEKDYLLKAIDSFKRRIIVVSPEFKILAYNRTEIGIDSDIINQYCYSALYKRSSKCNNCIVSDVQKNNKPACKNSREINLNIDFEENSCLYSYPITHDNEIDAFVILDFDFPAMGDLEGQLQRTNAFFKNLILSSVDGVIAADMNGKVFIFNDAAMKISGYTREEALSSLDIRSIYPNNGAKDIMHKLRSEDYGGKGKLKHYRVDVVGKNGIIIPISLNASIIYDGETEVASIGFFHDLREEQQVKKELEKTQIQLLQAEKMASLGKLAAGVAHQLNNPLGGIILFAKILLEEYELEESAQNDIQRILRDAERCRDTVKELLEFARQTKQVMRPHDINQSIRRTLFLLENQTLFHNIKITKYFESSLPHVAGDIQQLNHMFMNIILNAAEAMEGKGTLIVRTHLLDKKDRICIEIEDTGPGIPLDVLPHIFEPFFTTKEEGKGTGLGLSLVYGIVENHGGEITAKNKSNHNETGTIFIIELPIAGSNDENK
ncbi:MAG: PAS domain S-box protein [Desulfobacterales bacterium]|nr:PAS domain S-box protein [Desulfobacterales bacterium]